MTARVLFVSNGHGEVAIASRIAAETAGVVCDHLALVGGEKTQTGMNEVGPRRAMPSGGLIAMGNVRNIARDLGAGLIAHTFAQLRFLRSTRGKYDIAVAVGDIFALFMALQANARATIFVGTAKSVHHAKYGPIEQRLIREANRVFVRDAATADSLRASGIDAYPANVIVDLYADAGTRPIDAAFSPLLAIFPGSREPAYADAVALCAILRELARQDAQIGGVFSIAPGLDAARVATMLAGDGWRIMQRDDPEQPLSLYLEEREVARAWRGPLGAMLQHATLVLGQAGTANEAAAAAGIPVVAYEPSAAGKRAWYRMRQAGLLGDALLVVDGDVREAAQQVRALLDDDARRAHMGRIGRERMGPPGGAALIANSIQLFASVAAPSGSV
jgi:uncharacterized protein (TIGR03492 family)